MRVSDLFDPEPQTWGLRGDPHLWRALRARLAGRDIPASEGELNDLLHEAFRELAGTDLASDPTASVYRERYAHGDALTSASPGIPAASPIRRRHARLYPRVRTGVTS